MASPSDDATMTTTTATAANNDMCSVCYRDKGKLFWCDSCPKSYHARCVGAMTHTIEKEESWYCPSCVADGTARAAMIASGVLKVEDSKRDETSSSRRGGPTLNIKKRRRNDAELQNSSSSSSHLGGSSSSTSKKRTHLNNAVSAALNSGPRLHQQQLQFSIAALPFETLFAPVAADVAEQGDDAAGYCTLGRVLQHIETVWATPEQMRLVRDVLFDCQSSWDFPSASSPASYDYLVTLKRVADVVGVERFLEAVESSRGGTAFALSSFETCLQCNRWKVLRSFCLGCLHWTPELYGDVPPTKPEQRTRLRAIRKTLPPMSARATSSSSSSATTTTPSTSTPPLPSPIPETEGDEVSYEHARFEAAMRGINYFAEVCADEKNFAKFGGDMLFLALKLWNTCRVSPIITPPHTAHGDSPTSSTLVERSETVFRTMAKRFMETLPERRLTGEEEGMATLLDLAEGIHAIWFLARYDDELNKARGIVDPPTEFSTTPPLTELTTATPDFLLGSQNNTTSDGNSGNTTTMANNANGGNGDDGEEGNGFGRLLHRRAAGQKALEKIAKRHALNESFDLSSPKEIMRMCEGVKRDITDSLLRYHVTEWFGFNPHERIATDADGEEENDRNESRNAEFGEGGVEARRARAREYVAPPLTMARHCAHCGYDLNKKGFERCAKCQHVLNSHADFGALTDATVWAFVFDSMGVKLIGQTRAEVQVKDILSFVRGARASYKDMEYLGFDFWRLQCYFVTHFIYVMSDWGVCDLRRANFDEEFMLIAQSLPVAILKQDPELVGEFLHCLRILGFVPTREPRRGGANDASASLSTTSSDSSVTPTLNATISTDTSAPMPPSSSVPTSLLPSNSSDGVSPEDEKGYSPLEPVAAEGGELKSKRKYTKRKSKIGETEIGVPAGNALPSSTTSSTADEKNSSSDTFHRVLSRHFYSGVDFLLKHESSFDKCGGFVSPTSRDVYSKYHAAWTGVVGLISCPSSGGGDSSVLSTLLATKTARKPREMPFTPIELGSANPTFNCTDVRSSYYVE